MGCVVGYAMFLAFLFGVLAGIGISKIIDKE